MYTPQPLTCNPATLDGLSAKLVASHHENNDGGAVKRLNAIRAELANLDWAQAPGFKVGALKREELIARTRRSCMSFTSIGTQQARATL